MACATLKRSLEIDPMCGRPSKRRRCNPMATCAPAKDEEPSPFAEVTSRLNMDQISVSIREEMKRLHRRKQLYGVEPGSNGGPSSPESDAIDISGSPQPSASHSHQSSKPDKHLFTFRQVGMICERLLKEREETLRELYDEVLNTKLAEQYDTFVKFTYDQIQKRFDAAAAPSYLS